MVFTKKWLSVFFHENKCYRKCQKKKRRETKERERKNNGDMCIRRVDETVLVHLDHIVVEVFLQIRPFLVSTEDSYDGLVRVEGYNVLVTSETRKKMLLPSKQDSHLWKCPWKRILSESMPIGVVDGHINGQ
jgi:hypothetical protein